MVVNEKMSVPHLPASCSSEDELWRLIELARTEVLASIHICFGCQARCLISICNIVAHSMVARMTRSERHSAASIKS